MPQMSPTWWASLFMVFSMLYLITMIIIYFKPLNYTPQLKQLTFSKTKKNKNWSW